MKSRLRNTAGIAAVAALTLVTACDSPPPPPPPPPITMGEDPFAGIIAVTNKPPLKGAEVVADAQAIEAETKLGEPLRRSIRLLNRGDTPAQIRTLIAPEGVSLTGDCALNVVLEAQRSCEMRLEFPANVVGQNRSNITILTDAKVGGSQITIPLRVTVVEPPPPPRAEPPPAPPPPPPPPVVVAPPPPPPPDPLIRQLQEQHARRMESGIRRDSLGGQTRLAAPPRVEQVTRDPAYDREQFPGVDSSLPVDRSRILTTDRVIKAVLETPLYSPLQEGHPVVAQVSSHVYSPNGRNVLIPAGTKVIGKLSRSVDERVGIGWERILTPDGVSIRLENARAADAMGRAGVPGYIDRRLWDRYGTPLLLSLFNFGTSYSLADRSRNSQQTTTNSPFGTQTTQNNSGRQEAVNRLNEDIRGTAERAVEELRDIRPILDIPAGTRVDIVLSQDIYFKNAREVVAIDGERYEMPGAELPARVQRLPAPAVETQPTERTVPRTGSGDAIIEIDGKRYVLRPATSVQGENGQQRGTRPGANGTTTQQGIELRPADVDPGPQNRGGQQGGTVTTGGGVQRVPTAPQQPQTQPESRWSTTPQQNWNGGQPPVR